MHTVFLICSERSGSNLITRMVDNHPQFCGPSPTHLIRLLVQHRLAYGDLRVAENWDDLCADAADVLATGLGEWRTQPTALELLDVRPRTLPALLRHVFEGEARACGKERLFIKENHAARLLPFLLTAWPDAQFVYLVRDPRDMALSWKNSAIHRGDVVRAARVWQQDQAEGIAALAQLQDSQRLHRLSYEDLVVVPELELLRLCRFLNVRFCPAMLEFHQAPATVANARQTAAWENLAKPVIAGNARKWQEGLDNTEIALVEAVCAEGDGVLRVPARIGRPADTRGTRGRVAALRAPRQAPVPGTARRRALATRAARDAGAPPRGPRSGPGAGGVSQAGRRAARLALARFAVASGWSGASRRASRQP